MGHKVHPVGFRLGVTRGWQAKWFAPDKEYVKLLHEDIQMRRLLMGRLKNAGISRIETERSANQLTVTVFTAKPGIVIGKGGASVDQLRDELERISGKKVRVTIQEIKRPELDAKLVADNVAGQLEKRIAFRRAIKQSLLKTMRAGAQGIKIRVKGRLGGGEMARIAWDRQGRVPLHTLRANIDFGQSEAHTTFGRIGVSVWLFDREAPVAAPRVEEVLVEPVRTDAPLAPEMAAAFAPVIEPAVVAAEVPAAPAEPVPVAASPAAAPPKPRATRARATKGATTETGEVKPKAPRKAATQKTPARTRSATSDSKAPKAAGKASATRKPAAGKSPGKEG
jgi:small subunit ribosomal protein S3